MALSWNDLPKFATQAAQETSLEDAGHVISVYLSTWGDYTPTTLQRVVREGSRDDRIFALTALGLLESSDEVDALFSSLLNSEDEKERWASAIALGRHKQEQAFPVLQQRLVENMFGYANVPLFEWQLSARCTIAFLLGAWGRSEAVPALRQAFQTCWAIEQRFDLKAEPQHVNEYKHWWHFLEDRLAYVLGQLSAWGALNTRPPLSPIHRQVAIIFMILGSLHLDTQKIFAQGLAPRVFDRSHYPPATLAIFASYPDPPLFIEPETVARILLERFGLSEREQIQYIQDFARNYGIGRLEEDNYVPPEGFESHPF